MRAFLLGFALLLSAACRPQAAPALTDWLAAGYAERQFDLATAVDFYRRALAADPDNLRVRGRLLRVRIAAGDTKESLALARQMEASLPADGMRGKAARDGAVVTLRLAVAEMSRGDWLAAAGRLEGAGSQLLPGVFRLLALAWIRHASGDAVGAEKALSEAEQVQGAGSLTKLHRALIHRAAGRMAAARAAFESLGEASARGLLAAAAFQAEAGDAEAANRQLQRYRLMGGTLDIEDPASFEPPGSTPAAGVAEALYAVAETFHRRRVAMALIYARLAVMLDPGHHAALLLAGDILAERGQYDGAVAAYEAVPADSVWQLAAQRRRAEAYAAHGRFEDATALLEAAAVARPQDPYALGALGHLLRGEERYEDAVVAYDRAIARIERSPEPRHWRLYYGRGIAFERTQRWDRAEQDLLKALEFVPDHAYVLNYLGYSWVDRGEQYERAEEMLARAVDLQPGDGYIADSLGWVYFRTGRYDEAVEQLERAVALKPLDPVVNEHLGDAYWKVGRRLEAGFQWQRALDFDPDPERIEGLRQRLDCGLDCS